MKLATPVEAIIVSVAEERRLTDFYELRRREESTKRRAQKRDQHVQYLQTLFVYLFFAVVVGAAIFNRYDLGRGASKVTSKVTSKIRNMGNSVSLRQDTLKYEQEVAQLAEKP